MSPDYNFPVWATQGGGLVKQEGKHYVFVEPPPDSDIQIGDKMHPQWDLIPANNEAREELDEEFPDRFDVMGDVEEAE